MTIAQADPRSSLLLDPAFMARLDQLDLVSRKMLAGKMKGERRSKRRGQSVEFADYRNYVVGDDLRFIDWKTRQSSRQRRTRTRSAPPTSPTTW